MNVMRETIKLKSIAILKIWIKWGRDMTSKYFPLIDLHEREKIYHIFPPNECHEGNNKTSKINYNFKNLDKMGKGYDF